VEGDDAMPWAVEEGLKEKEVKECQSQRNERAKFRVNQ
jgi:hypothetical protein